MDLFNSLPEEITLDVISRLPAEDVLRCKLVCTNWRSLVRNPLFSEMHLHHVSHPVADSGKLGFIATTYINPGNSFKIDPSYSFNLHYFEYNENHQSIERITRVNYKPPFGDETEFVGLCNGLICLSQDKHCCLPEKTYICNPITREYIIIPVISTGTGGIYDGRSGFDPNKLPQIKSTKLYFGYVSSTNEYKVVAVILFKETEFMEVSAYTLGSGNGWRNLGKFNLGTTIEHWEQSVYFNGSLYWMDHHLRKIVTFDLAEENFSDDLSPPPLLSEYDECQLRVLDGCLSFAIYGLINEAEYWDVWLLKNKDDNHCMKEPEGHQSMGWRKEFRVFDSEEFRLSDSESPSEEEECRILNTDIFAVTKSCDVLIHRAKHINIHNPKISTSKSIMDFKDRIGMVFPHKNTLVSLKELGEADTKMMESVETEETESHAQPLNQLLEDDDTLDKNILLEHFLNSVSLEESGEEDTNMTESVEMEDDTLNTYL